MSRAESATPFKRVIASDERSEESRDDTMREHLAKEERTTKSEERIADFPLLPFSSSLCRSFVVVGEVRCRAHFAHGSFGSFTRFH